jgi:hypothetical protein
MPTLEIDGLGNVEVGDEFLKLTPEQQDQTVQEIAASLRESKEPPSDDPAPRRDLPEGLFSPSPAFRHGLSLGLSDEIAGAARAALPLVKAPFTGDWAAVGNAYRSGQQEEQARIDKYRAENAPNTEGGRPTSAYWPVNRATSEEILGGLVGGGARMKAPAPAGTPAFAAPTAASPSGFSGYVQGAKEGAALGATAGFGYSDPGLENTVKGTAAGAGLGALVGAGIPAGLDLGRWAWNRLTGGNPATRALQSLDDALRADDVTPKRLETRLGTLGEQATIADAGGVKTRALVREATIKGNLGNRVNTRLDQRQAGASGRIMHAVRRTLSSSDDAAQTIDDLVRERATKARPLYDQAYARPIESPTNLNVLLRNPHMERAWGRAQDLINLERDTARAQYARALLDGDDTAAAEANQILRLPELYTRTADGARAINPKAVETTQVWDYVKRALDDEIASKMRVDEFGRSHATNESRLLGNMRREMLTEVDRQNPAFAKARATFQGDSDTIEAVELGRRVYQGDANIALRDIEALPEGQKELFRIGLADAIRQRLEGTRVTHNAGMRIFGTPDQMARIRAAFPKGPEGNRAYREFQEAIIAESRKMRTRRIVPAEAGSQTQPRQQAAQDFGGAALDAATGNKLGIVRRLLVGDGMPQEVADEILKRAVNTSREANTETMRELEKLLLKKDYWNRLGSQAQQMVLSGGLTSTGTVVSQPRLTQ